MNFSQINEERLDLIFVFIFLELYSFGLNVGFNSNHSNSKVQQKIYKNRFWHAKNRDLFSCKNTF